MSAAQFDIVALAKRINLRREEYNRLHPRSHLRITSVLSRILENDPDYLPYRERARERKHDRPSRNPSVRTLVEIANILGTTVGDLLGEQPTLPAADRARIRAAVRTLIGLLPQEQERE